MDAIVQLTDVEKYYRLYKRPADRFREAMSPFGRKYHERVFALKKLTLGIPPGQVLGIVGRNGSGKSTLLKLIAGILTPNSGTLQLKGRVTALLELGAGFNPEFSGEENLRFYARILGLERAEIEDRLPEMVEFSELGNFIEQPLKTYSSGMRARLAFSVAASVSPEILILDEVLAVGDEPFKRKCYARMEALFESKTTILYVSHDANSINRLCSRAVLLNEGELILDDEPKLVTAEYQRFSLTGAAPARPLYGDRLDPIRTAPAPRQGDPRASEIQAEQRLFPAMVSKARMEYRNADVTIKNEKILDASGECVNVLDFGESYELQAEVHFDEPAEDVCFGVQLRDLAGVDVSSVESAQINRAGLALRHVDVGTRYTVRFHLNCTLCAGSYVVNLGVSSFSGEQRVLVRIVDALMFRVRNPVQHSAGYVQLFDGVRLDPLNEGRSAITLVRDGQLCSGEPV